MFGFWWSIFDVRCLMLDAWCLMLPAWRLMLDAWCVMLDECSMVIGSWLMPGPGPGPPSHEPDPGAIIEQLKYLTKFTLCWLFGVAAWWWMVAWWFMAWWLKACGPRLEAHDSLPKICQLAKTSGAGRNLGSQAPHEPSRVALNYCPLNYLITW